MNMRVSTSAAVNCMNGFTADPNGAAKWNSFGGGPTVTDMSKFPPAAGSSPLQPFDLPIILRIGDPRIPFMQKYYAAVYNDLASSNRVENAAKKITDEDTMKDAIQAATNFTAR